MVIRPIGSVVKNPHSNCFSTGKVMNYKAGIGNFRHRGMLFNDGWLLGTMVVVPHSKKIVEKMLLVYIIAG